MIWWNQCSLGNYLSKNMIPCGLWLQIFLSYGMQNKGFVLDGKRLVDHPLRHWSYPTNFGYSRGGDWRCCETKRKIIVCRWYVNKFYKRELDNTAKIWEKQMKTLKTMTFQRDLHDIQSNQIYKWRQGRQRIRKGASSISSNMPTSTDCNMSSTSQRYNAQHKKPIDGQEIKPIIWSPIMPYR